MKKFPYKDLSLLENKIFKSLKDPQKIQDFLDKTPINFEKNGETLYSPRFFLKERKAHCIEGALFAAAALWYHGRPPMLMDFQTIPDDEDHVVTLFKKESGWGAISKTNHALLRYRDPIYKSPRELAMSYFHEYQHKGKKSMRAFSRPFDMSKFGSEWVTSKKNLSPIAIALDKSPHERVLSRMIGKKLRPLSQIEKKIHLFTEWKK